MDKLKKIMNDEKVIIVSHQGLGGGNIVLNTYNAYQNALNNGATMLEIDIARTKDGVFYVFHQELEKYRLPVSDKMICDLTSKELDEMFLINSSHVPSFDKVERVESMFKKLKGDTILNLDKCWMFGKEFLEYLDTMNIEDQVILKSEWNEEYINEVKNYKTKFMFMPIAFNMQDIKKFEEIEGINIVGYELIFNDKNAEHVQKRTIDKLKEKGYFLWVNAITLGQGFCLSAEYDDDISLLDNPKKGWGQLIDMGFNVIQTDWPYQLKNYLNTL